MRFPRFALSVFSAITACTRAVSVETDEAVAIGNAASVPSTASRTIAGVPVYNYDRIIEDRTRFGVAHEGRWLVALKPGTPREAFISICSRTGSCALQGEHSQLPFIAVQGTADALATVVAPMRDFSRYIDLDFTVRRDPLPPSPRPDQQGVPVASVGSSLWGLERIRANRRSTLGAGVHVFVGDSGVRSDHVEFGGRAFPYLDMFNSTLTEEYLCDQTKNNGCSGDVDGHGTHCAGTIAGRQYGVAPQALVYSVKVLNDDGRGSVSGFVYGMTAVANSRQRPAVLSMSMGSNGRSEIIEDAVNLVVGESVVVVAAAGNEYSDACGLWPANVPSAITVGSIAAVDVRSAFSNFGACVDLWAPGSDILSAVADSSNASGYKSGTSMACPHVSGAAALLLEGNATLSPMAVRQVLRQMASLNYISDLSPADDNLLLYVSAERQDPKPPRSDPWPTDDFFAACKNKGQLGPFVTWGAPECMCSRRRDRFENGTICYSGDTNEPGCPANDGMHLYFFLLNCTDCNCYEGPPGSDVPEIRPQRPLATVLGIIGTLVAVMICATMHFLGQNRGSAEAQQELAQPQVP